MSPQKVYYKNVRRLPDGRLVSSWVDWPLDNRIYSMLDYSLGSVTVSLPNSMGIFVYDNLKSAKAYVYGNTSLKVLDAVLEIHYAYPVGDMMDRWKHCRTTMFPAIRLGRRVPKSKFTPILVRDTKSPRHYNRSYSYTSSQ